MSAAMWDSYVSRGTLCLFHTGVMVDVQQHRVRLCMEPASAKETVLLDVGDDLIAHAASVAQLD